MPWKIAKENKILKIKKHGDIGKELEMMIRF